MRGSNFIITYAEFENYVIIGYFQKIEEKLVPNYM